MNAGDSLAISALLFALIAMQFISALIGLMIKRPLLPVVSSSILTGALLGSLMYRHMPFEGGASVAVITGVLTAVCHCALMDKVLGKCKREDAA